MGASAANSYGTYLETLRTGSSGSGDPTLRLISVLGDGPRSISDLTNALPFDLSTVIGLVNSANSVGLVAIRDSGLSKMIELTPEGNELRNNLTL